MQGAFTVPEGMQRTYIAAEDQYSLFYRELWRALGNNGIEVAATPAEATAVVVYTPRSDRSKSTVGVGTQRTDGVRGLLLD